MEDNLVIGNLIIGKLTLGDIEQFIDIDEHPTAVYPWTQVEHIALSAAEQTQVAFITDRLSREPTHLLNEATIWARAIYPLLLLAEHDAIRARAQVPLSAVYRQFRITGIADGVLGKAVGARMIAPYVVVVKAKRGIENLDPVPHLYGEMLAAASLNWTLTPQRTQTICGCYTIADTWTFVQGEISAIDSDRPGLKTEFSQEYSQKHEAEKIMQILKSFTCR